MNTFSGFGPLSSCVHWPFPMDFDLIGYLRPPLLEWFSTASIMRLGSARDSRGWWSTTLTFLAPSCFYLSFFFFFFFFRCTLPFTGCLHLILSAVLCIEQFPPVWHPSELRRHWILIIWNSLNTRTVQGLGLVIRCNLRFGRCHGQQRSKANRLLQRMRMQKRPG